MSWCVFRKHYHGSKAILPVLFISSWFHIMLWSVVSLVHLMYVHVVTSRTYGFGLIWCCYLLNADYSCYSFLTDRWLPFIYLIIQTVQCLVSICYAITWTFMWHSSVLFSLWWSWVMFCGLCYKLAAVYWIVVYYFYATCEQCCSLCF
jgi:hypothetical protein